MDNKNKTRKNYYKCAYGERLPNGKCPPKPKGPATKKNSASPAAAPAARRHTYANNACTDKMSFDECELAILRKAVDDNEKQNKADFVKSSEIREIVNILEDFLRQREYVCYGGTALNNILPKEAQFYDRDLEIPDYDFYSPNAMQDAKDLANRYFAAGMSEVEAKVGVHEGTYKVFVNSIPVADLTYLHPTLYNTIKHDARKVDGIFYAPPNFLRMNMYVELSRPKGDISRWEKIFKRLVLLNRYFPLETRENCETATLSKHPRQTNSAREHETSALILQELLKHDVVFFGGFARSQYARFMDASRMKKLELQENDFMVLTEDPDKLGQDLVKALQNEGHDATLQSFTPISEILAESIHLILNGAVVAVLFKPTACYSYNPIDYHGKEAKIATINTILVFYLALMFSKDTIFDSTRLICFSKFLFDVEQSNRLEQNGILRRFTLNCYGKQMTLNDIRIHKSRKYKELRAIRNKTVEQQGEYERLFFKYNPADQVQRAAAAAAAPAAAAKPVAAAAPKGYAVKSSKSSSSSSSSTRKSKSPPPKKHAVYVPPARKPALKPRPAKK